MGEARPKPRGAMRVVGAPVMGEKGPSVVTCYKKSRTGLSAFCYMCLQLLACGTGPCSHENVS